MKKIYGIILYIGLSLNSLTFGAGKNDLFLNGNQSDIISAQGVTPITILTLVQGFLLKALLPIILIGSSLYIAYELFTAEGDEAKMKKAWKSVAYSAIGLIAIALSYAFVGIISRLSF